MNDNPRSAVDIKGVRRALYHFPGEDMKLIALMSPGAVLEAEETYLDYKDPRRQPFSGDGKMQVGADEWIVRKSDVPLWLWNRLLVAIDPQFRSEA